jgi:S1-C subfamily serine protease
MHRAILAFGLIVLPSYASVHADDAVRLADVTALQATMQKAIERAEPSIACIMVSRGDGKDEFKPEDPIFVPKVYGSGVVIDPQGLILTNEHVVHGAPSGGIYVRLPGDKASFATIWASDQRSDLAVLKLDTALPGLKAISLGQGEKLRKGQFVLSLANPFAAGFRDGNPSASWGIISNLRRRAPLLSLKKELEPRSDIPLSQFGMLIQTDARLNLGCSGGALIDLEGKLVGLTTALAALNGSETPGGFAIPIDTGMRGIIEKLRRGEEVEYGFLGVQFPRGNVPTGAGVMIQQLVAGGPAENAGMQFDREGCVILTIDDMPCNVRSELSFLISTRQAGTPIRIEWRSVNGGASKHLRVTLGKMYMPPDGYIASKRPPAVGGVRVDYASTLARHFTNEWRSIPIPRGVAIREVEQKSAAERAGLTVDSIITQINGRSVETPADFYAAAAAAKGTLRLTIHGRTETIQLDPR